MNKLKIEYLPISEIKPYENNPRKNDKAVDIVAKSIKEFGFNVPIIIDKYNEVIAGHTRLKASQKLGLTEVPVIKAENLTEDQVKAFRIMDNKSSEYAEWDQDLLQAEMEGLKISNYNLDLTGFSEIELDKLLHEDLIEPEFPNPAKPKYLVKTGDIYQLGNHRLLCGDSFKKEAVDKLMNGQKADLVFTDPPYNVAYNTQTLGKDGPFRHKVIEGDKQSREEWKIFSQRLCQTIKENCNGTMYIFHAPGPDGRIIATSLDNNFHWSATIIWNKGSMILGRANYQRQYEPIWYGWNEEHLNQDDRTQTDVWDVLKPLKNDLHPTMKPIELCKRAIINSTLPSAKVIDLFGGSGSTLIACEQTNRKCYMMEIDPLYCSVIIERWENLTKQKAVKLSSNSE